MIKKLLLAFLFIFVTPTLSYSQSFFSEPISHSVTDTTRVTFGWARNTYKTFKNNALEVRIKMPDKASIFTFSFGASESQENTTQIAKGDLGFNLIDVLSLDLPQSYLITSDTSDKMWIGQLGYQVYKSFFQMFFWKYYLDVYGSTGIIAQVHMMQNKTSYNVKITLDDEQQITDTIDNPLDFGSDDFHIALPLCLNVDAAMFTVSGCGLLHTDNYRDSNLQGSVTIGF
jgi:hypothetical protein